jgi:hypothetical protein
MDKNKSVEPNHMQMDSGRSSSGKKVFDRLYQDYKKKETCRDLRIEKEQIKENKSKLKKVEVDSMLSRFKFYEVEKEVKIQQIKRQVLRREEQTLKKVPKISQNSKKLHNCEEDFLTRMEKLKEQSDLKKKEMIDKEHKRKAEEETQILQEARSRHKKRLDKSYLEEKVNNLLEWDTKRKFKINKLHDEENKRNYDDCTFKPEINRNSNKIATQRKNHANSDKDLVVVNKHTNSDNLTKPKNSVEENFMIFKDDPIIQQIIKHKIKNSKKNENL